MKNVATTGKRVGYGWLYNWYAVNNAKGLAPDNWSIPTEAQWDDELINYLGGPTLAGGKLKSTRNEWLYPNTGAIDQYLFSILPGGYRTRYGDFYYLSMAGPIWTATDYSPDGAQYFDNYYASSNSSTSGTYKTYGYSIRCLQSKQLGEVDGDTGTVTDIDGNVYKWVVIGDYRWMAENLRTTKYKNGDTIPEITGNIDWGNAIAGARCAYNNDHYYVYPPNK